MSATRLDRLVTLLETGHTPLIRNTAAQQLADVQKQHPDELFNLLSRVVPYLRSKSWETRRAAAKALGGIVENATKYDPNEDDYDGKAEAESDDSMAVDSPVPSADQFTFSDLVASKIVENGFQLLGKGSREYDYQFIDMSPVERLEHQKRTLRDRLGFNGKYVEADHLPKDVDMSRTVPMPKIDTSVSRLGTVSSPVPMSPLDPETPMDDPGSGALTNRQLNLLKRKKKREMKSQANKVRLIDLNDRSNGFTDLQSPGSAQPVAIKTGGVKSEEEENGNGDYFSLNRQNGDDDSKLVAEFKGEPITVKSEFVTESEENGSEWPFERLCEFLAIDLFDPSWEVRHGSSMGLREILRIHGSGAGRVRGKTRKQNNMLNKQWLDDLACRICCVFMLDRFGDYVSDSVIVPVRESSGQALAAVLKHMPVESVKSTFGILRKLVEPEEESGDMLWQPRHGGIIGLRYLVSTRDDLLAVDATLLDNVLACVMKSLEDDFDDVRAVSAATLIPIAKNIVENKPAVLNSLILIIWDSLSKLGDDLSASTGSVMDLLAKLSGFDQVLNAMQENAARSPELSFAQLMPRLYPFLRHTISSVRSAVLRALLTFMRIDDTDADDGGWITSRILRLLFQNLLLERDEGVLALSLEVWNGLIGALVRKNPQRLVDEMSPILAPLLTLAVHPMGVPRHNLPMDVTFFIRPNGNPFAAQATRKISPANGTDQPKKRKRTEKKESVSFESLSHNIDGAAMAGDVELLGADGIIRNKLHVAKALGFAIASWPAESRSQAFSSSLRQNLASHHSSSQLFTALIIEEFAKSSDKSQLGSDSLAADLAVALRPIVDGQGLPWYADLTSYLLIVRSQCQGLVNIFREHVSTSKVPILAAIVQGEENAGPSAFSLADGAKIANADFDRLMTSLSASARLTHRKMLDDARRTTLDAIEQATSSKDTRDIRIRSAAAAAVVALGEVPKKPASTIKAIMDSVKSEENIDLQRRSAEAVARLINFMVNNGKKNIADKVVGNLVKFYCTETAETPEFHTNAAMIDGILSMKKEEDVRDHADAVKFEKEARLARIMRRGSKEALEQVVGIFGADLFETLPALRNIIESSLRQAFSQDDLPATITDSEDTFGQSIVDGLSTLRALVSKFHPSLHPFVVDLLPVIAKALKSKLAVLRYAAAKCFSTICSVMTVEGITMLVENVLPAISNPLDVRWRQGAIECIYHLIHVMEDRILPYVIFLIVPVLGRMSDSDHDVRLIAATTFATLVKLVPLEAGIPDPPGFSEEMLKGRERERNFIAQMLDPKKAEDFKIPVAIKAELRPYQQDGVNWLGFLNKYNLHGILCDDMGLGKTLQTLCIVASDHFLRAEDYAKSENPDSRRLPSLIVCPPTLSGHWQQEIAQFAPFLKAFSYTGPSAERQKNRHLLADADIVITSYEVCRNDVDFLGPLNWNYCVLDEGHLIKNPKAKTSIAVKSLKSYHRLILSGTPIQNNVLELWSLFDFLMPGFLGSEKVFHDRFSKPIAASRNAKANSKEQEAGALAIEGLHKQVLPFLLRRLKEEVLNDLPPKIIQNYYCDLSELQRKLFSDFGKKEKGRIQQAADEKSTEGQKHIFQALQYMRKLCNAPSLVIKENHKSYQSITADLAKKGSVLSDIVHAPKLTALKDLLVDCGIGAQDINQDSTSANSQFATAESGAVSQHRALIFCQMKEMLDMVQESVFKKLLPSVQYLRLDGGVEAHRRQDIVNKFNSDPSYDCLLLTTSVGGLGLNLTGADTVIFVEHDWNPQKDMQAMDRAHRIGQKKVVNVYRIVTRGTLEEKILK
jgi:TATA-binding protein-associated factor